MPRDVPQDDRLVHAYTTWLTGDDAARLESAAAALGWTCSQLLRWSVREGLPRAEEVAKAMASAKKKKRP